MSSIPVHPTVRKMTGATPPARRIPDAKELRQLCLDAGADDVGFVSLSRSEMAGEREEILRIFPSTRALIALVCRMNPDAVRSPARNLANHEFHATGDDVNDVARRIVKQLQDRGLRALNPPMAFPMEMERYPGKIWSISLKPLAVAAGLGQIGLHRNVIHPVFGNFILLGCVLIDFEPEEQGRAIDFNPCMTCKLCVAACPVGAIGPEGEFNFASCSTHNYREFMSGFTDWVETVADSRSAVGYRQRVTDSESTSMWQSLAYGPNYKAAYCLAVCPAGEDVIGPFLEDRPEFLRQNLQPLQKKTEIVYVRPNSDADDYVRRRFPHKQVRHVGKVLRPSTLQGFVRTMHVAFQPGRARKLKATYHFDFSGAEAMQVTVTIDTGRLNVQTGHIGACDLRVRVDSTAWVRFLREEIGLLKLLLVGGLRLRGNPRLLASFGACFA